MRFHGVFLESQHEMWSKQHNGKVRKARLQHEVQLALKQRDQSFNLSITSHMANVLFDKHVAFCEEYAARAHQCVRELFRDGPSENAMSIFQELTAIRQKHA